MALRLLDFREWANDHTVHLAAVAVPLVVVIGVAGFLLQSLLAEQSQQTTLQEQLVRLGDIAASPPGRLESVTQEFEQVQDAIPSAELGETEVFELVLGKALSRGLTAQIDFRGQDLTKLGDTKYRLMSFGMTASGSYDALWDLLLELDGGPEDLVTLVLKKLSVTIAGDTGRATFDFVVYTRI